MSINKNIFVMAVILCCVSAGRIYSQTNQNSIKAFASKYDAFIQQVTQKIPEIPAIAVVVIKDDKPIFLKTYGYADKEAGIKSDENTLFYIASSTKSFTALAAAMLDKEGTIKLTDPMINYAKGIAFKNQVPAQITIQNLLTHTSGLTNDPLTFRMAYSGDIEPKDISRLFTESTEYIDSNYNHYHYDNLGYNIYGILLKQSTGKNWQDLLEDRIFKPLKMDHTTTSISKALANKWTIAHPYVYTPDKGEVKSWLNKNDNTMHSAGGIVTSISDIGKWLSVNMDQGRVNGKQIFSADLFQKTQTGYTKTQRELPPFTGAGEYGLGWQIGNYKNEKVIYHHGGYTGCQSHVSFLPGKGIAVAVFVNDGTVGATACHMIAAYAYDWWLQVADLENNYATQLNDLATRFEAGKKSMQADFAEKSKRTWQLSMPLESYTGKYYNSSYGTMEVYVQNNVLAVKLGAMKAASAPFPENECIRVELIPGSGRVIKFGKDALTWAGIEFRKIE